MKNFILMAVIVGLWVIVDVMKAFGFDPFPNVHRAVVGAVFFIAAIINGLVAMYKLRFNVD